MRFSICSGDRLGVQHGGTPALFRPLRAAPDPNVSRRPAQERAQ